MLAFTKSPIKNINKYSWKVINKDYQIMNILRTERKIIEIETNKKVRR